GALLTTALSEATRVAVGSGAPARFEMPTDSGRPHGVYRCATCGTAIWSEYGGTAKIRFMRAGTLEDPRALAPTVHIYTRTKQPWVALPPDVPAFEAYYDAKK